MNCGVSFIMGMISPEMLIGKFGDSVVLESNQRKAVWAKVDG